MAEPRHLVDLDLGHGGSRLQAHVLEGTDDAGTFLFVSFVIGVRDTTYQGMVSTRAWPELWR